MSGRVAMVHGSGGKATGELIDQIFASEFQDQTLDEIRPTYRFNGTCQGSVPESIQAFLESTDYEDSIRNTISLGGDADTMGAITGSIAWAYYGREGITQDMEALWAKASRFIPEELIERMLAFQDFCKKRQ